MKVGIFLLLFLPLLFNIILCDENQYIHHYKPRLLIKIPTRKRPEQFFRMLNLYYQKLSGEIPYLFLISCDNNDSTMNNQEVIATLKTYPFLYFRFGNSKSKIEAYNADIDEFIYQFDILIVTSDDMEPLENGYDKIIVQKMLKHFPDFSGVLSFGDGFTKTNINTYPILGINYYLKFGYVYYPEYKSFFCDIELNEVSRFLQKEARFADIVLFKHNYMLNGLDNTYYKSLKGWFPDQALYHKRKQHEFYLE